ncbi:restriction endonuclease [Paraburkholderia sp. RL18-103-BIB-C]|uniref:restriction endonuclease n=1 Tax=unclassified Paraburkholderia TaxID=2615204 RepID=UPI0038BCA2E1
MMTPASPDFARAADQLRQEEFARLSRAIVPTVESLRLLHGPELRGLVVSVLDRSGYEVQTAPDAGNLVTTKDEKKYLVAIAPRNSSASIPVRDLMRLHDAVIEANAAEGFFVTTRGFTPDAEAYAATAPLKLMDGRKLVISIQRSMQGITMPDTYRAMCRQCGNIVSHHLDRAEARTCSNGHVVAPTIAQAVLIGRKQEGGSLGSPYTEPRPYSRREVRAHNAKYESSKRKTKSKKRTAKAQIDVDPEFDADPSP